MARALAAMLFAALLKGSVLHRSEDPLELKEMKLQATWQRLIKAPTYGEKVKGPRKWSKLLYF